MDWGGGEQWIGEEESNGLGRRRAMDWGGGE